jgi:hypothetical protein
MRYAGEQKAEGLNVRCDCEDCDLYGVEDWFGLCVRVYVCVRTYICKCACQCFYTVHPQVCV